MKEAQDSSETSVLTRATRRNFQEDTILYYKFLTALVQPVCTVLDAAPLVVCQRPVAEDAVRPLNVAKWQHLKICLHSVRGAEVVYSSVVGIATDYGLDYRGVGVPVLIRSNVNASIPSTPALGPTQSYIQWVVPGGLLPRGVQPQRRAGTCLPLPFGWHPSAFSSTDSPSTSPPFLTLLLRNFSSWNSVVKAYIW
jgi:hypothetical protein